MTKKQYELARKVNQNDIDNAFGYINSILDKTTELFLYSLKKDTYFKKLKPIKKITYADN